MPYIPKEDRVTARILVNAVEDGAELQYVIARMIQRMIGDDYRYKDLEMVMGALTGALREFQRCVVDPYEQKKLEENGGIYG